MGYTKTELIEKIETAATNMVLFYKAPFINYSGKTTDTNEYYTEIICAWLLDHLDVLDKIPMITREACYVTPSHDGIPKNVDSNRTEELIAMAMFRQSSFPLVGRMIDYQTPLKNERNDKAGKIDLLSYDGKTLRVLELKEPDSNENMLRCVIEGYTYMRTMDQKKLLCDFKLPEDTIVFTNPLVEIHSRQRMEMDRDRPMLKQLMATLNVKPLYYEQVAEDVYKITEG